MPASGRVFPETYICRRCVLPLPGVPVCRSLPDLRLFQLAGRDFQSYLLHGIAELFDHENGAFFGERHNAYAAGVVYHITLHRLAVLQPGGVFGDIEHLAQIGGFTADCFFL